MPEKQTFESALQRLEEIVAQLEKGEINLNEMLKIYEEGAKLIKFCLDKLDDAESKIKLLTDNEQNDFKLEKFEKKTVEMTIEELNIGKKPAKSL